MSGFQIGTYTEADDLAGIGIGYYREETKSFFKPDIGYIANPNLHRTSYFHLFYQVGINRQMMQGISGTAAPAPFTQQKPIIAQDMQESITAQMVTGIKIRLVHIPEFFTSNTRIQQTDTVNEFKDKADKGSFLKIFIRMFIIGLFTYTNQPAKRTNPIGKTLCVKPFYCLVPAFFRMSIWYIYSATSTIVSNKSARIFSLVNSSSFC